MADGQIVPLLVRSEAVIRMSYYVYILTNDRHTVLYTGVTNDLARRLSEHSAGQNSASFTAKYRVHKLVYYEFGETSEGAIAREKQIKAGSRQKKINLINGVNPAWRDLSGEW